MSQSVLLLHGFGVLANRYLSHHLIRVKSQFEKAGFDVLMPQNAPYQRPEKRVAFWKLELLRWGQGPVALVGHSQGGIEALLLSMDATLRSRIASVHVVAAPLYGTPAAFGLSFMPAGLLRRLSVLFEAESRRLFPDAPADLRGAGASLVRPPELRVLGDIPVFSYVCQTPLRDFFRLPPPFMPLWMLNRIAAGPNDGLVPIKSQRAGTLRGPFFLNHGEQLGLFRDKRRQAIFEQLWAAVIADATVY